MIEFNKEKFAERMRSAVKNAGGNGKIADVTGISGVNISRYITAKTVPSAEMLANIASACGVTSDYLLYGDVDHKKSEFSDITVLNTVKYVAIQLAELEHPHIKIDIQPEAFADAFTKLVRYKLEENASPETMDNVIRFSFSR